MNRTWVFLGQITLLALLWDSMRPVFDVTLQLRKPLISIWMLALVFSTGLAAWVQ